MIEYTWSSVSLPMQSELDQYCTKSTVSKIELLVKHIVAFREELVAVSVMAQDLEQLLEAQLSIINKRKTEGI